MQDDGVLEQVIGKEPTPELAATVADEVRRLLESLPNDSYRTIAVKKLEGYTNDEIAESQGCCTKNVEYKLRNIRATWLPLAVRGTYRGVAPMTFESLPSTVRNELDARLRCIRSGLEDGPATRRSKSTSASGRSRNGPCCCRCSWRSRSSFGARPATRPAQGEYLERFEAYTEVIRTVLADPRPDERDRDRATSDDRTEGRTSRRRSTRGRLSRCRPISSAGRPIPRAGPCPRRIGRYQVIRELGRGNFQVYLARDDRDGRDVAIKVARPDDPSGRQRLMSLADEAEKLQALNHPRIVKLYEYVPAGEHGHRRRRLHRARVRRGATETLEELFRAGPVPVLRLIRIVALVAETLHYAHTHASHLVHRDLKPSNILLDLQGEPHVCDFGLAVDEEIQRLRRGEVAGTPPYMAPEQVRGETTASTAAPTSGPWA